MDILIIGSGGREHSLAWKLKQSPKVRKIYIAPGNGGTHAVGEDVAIEATDVEKLLAFALEKKIGLTVVGPENPLALGVVDAFQTKGLVIFGPTKAAAQVESSKAFAKNLMQEAGVPTAEFGTFKNEQDAFAYVQKRGAPIVIKDSGLVFGKGVRVCQSVPEAETALKEIFSEPDKEVVIEDFLDGPEVSIHALCAGTDFRLFPATQDHKRIGNGDTGKMTGGIGAIYPLPFVTEELMQQIGETIVRPTLETLAKRGTPFSGLLYPGLILTSRGPKVLEYNARFGDPECELYMRLLKNDLFDVLLASATDDLSKISLEFEKKAGVNLILCSGGYPDDYKKGLPITGIEEAGQVEGVIVFHAGTTMQSGQLVTNGGRVLAVSAVGENLKQALDRAYTATNRIEFEGKYFRRDIGAKSLQVDE
jgi:phosphoribosylamine--glycine ligase